MMNYIKPVEKKISVFEDKFKNTIFSYKPPLKDELETFLFKNPKRLRPIFVFLFSEILKIKNDVVFDIAILSELVHSASLLHDDVIDEEKTRRNNITINKKYNSKVAILMGDILLSIFLDKASSLDRRISKIYSDAIFNTLYGEINQNLSSYKIPTIENYLDKTLNKTANIFLAGLNSLFLFSDMKKNIKDKLISFMKNYALAFQIANDIKDAQSSLNDIKNGNYTLAVIYFSLENDISSYKEKKSEFNKAILKSKEVANMYIQNAVNDLDIIEDNEYKSALLNLCKNILR